LVVWNIFMTFHILGMSSSQLTKSIIFQRGRYTTNQMWLMVIGAYFITQYVRPWPSYSIGGVPNNPTLHAWII
jgi:hypothetical protein